ncbi:LysM peptidoglycan-binding domain-containing protein [Roseivirga sp.]|uniref:LysM peptidoglycan-binding domain-containing protein n=1 Tax=Roseivirga sp. TaxID=1964215 RepID=UPI003B8D8237
MRRIFGIIILTITFNLTVFGQADSLGIEKVGDKVFVVHKVMAKQTLFSLAKRYKTTVTEINNANASLSTGLQIGQTLKIPFGGTLPSKNKVALQTTTEEVEHKVAAGETLFAIAKKYNVSITELKEWNQLSSNALSLGQALKVKVEKQVEATAKPIKTTETSTPEVAPVEQPSVPPVTVKVDTAAQKTGTIDPEPEAVAYDGRSFESFELEGMAEVIDEEEPSTKYFALHKTARVGTVIKVKNLMNDLTVYVRVVGTIPDTTVNDDVIIKLNLKAYTQLKAIDKRFRVQLSYFQ